MWGYQRIERRGYPLTELSGWPEMGSGERIHLWH